MPISGVVLLGEVAARLQLLEVACNRCERRGRLRTDWLVAEHGPAHGGKDRRLHVGGSRAAQKALRRVKHWKLSAHNHSLPDDAITFNLRFREIARVSLIYRGNRLDQTNLSIPACRRAAGAL